MSSTQEGSIKYCFKLQIMLQKTEITTKRKITNVSYVILCLKYVVASIWSAQAICVCACVWGRKSVYLNVHWCMCACRAPVFCVLFKAVMGPHCSINDYDKRPAPSPALVHNPFPKYLPTRMRCMFFTLKWISKAGSKRKKHVSVSCFLLVCIKCWNRTSKSSLFFSCEVVAQSFLFKWSLPIWSL